MNIVRDYLFSVSFLWSSQIGAACRVVLFLDDVFTSLPLLTSPWLIWDMNRIIVVGLASLRFLLALILSMLFYSSTEWSNPRFVFFCCSWSRHAAFKTEFDATSPYERESERERRRKKTISPVWASLPLSFSRLDIVALRRTIYHLRQ